MNRIPRSRVAQPSTVEALQRAQNSRFSLAEVIEEKAIPVSKGTLSRILTGGGVSLQAENAVRLALDEGALSADLAPCPTCHGDHGMQGIPDCHGAPVAAVVCLGADEKVAHKGKPRNRKPAAVIHVPPELHAAVMADRRPGESLADVVMRQRHALTTLRAAAAQPFDVCEIDDPAQRHVMQAVDGFWRGLILAEVEN